MPSTAHGQGAHRAPLICCFGSRRISFGTTAHVPERTLQQGASVPPAKLKFAPVLSYKLGDLIDSGTCESQPSPEDSALGPAGPNKKPPSARASPSSCCWQAETLAQVVKRSALSRLCSPTTHVARVAPPRRHTQLTSSTAVVCHTSVTFLETVPCGSDCSKWSISCDATHPAALVHTNRVGRSNKASPATDHTCMLGKGHLAMAGCACISPHPHSIPEPSTQQSAYRELCKSDCCCATTVYIT